MQHRLFTGLFLLLCINANAADKILECDGTWKQEGMNIPPHAKDFVQSGKIEVTQQYLVSDKSITIVSASPNIKNDTIQLCSKTDATYTYSWDCAVKQPRLMAVEWTQEDDPTSENSNFYKKWTPKPESYIGAKIIYLDRVNLSVTDDQYTLHMSTDDDASGKPTLKPKNYAIIDHTKLQCRIAKSKL
jgi:hypothetical protein